MSDTVVHVEASDTHRQPACGKAVRAFSDDVVVALDSPAWQEDSDDTKCWECKAVAG